MNKAEQRVIYAALVWANGRNPDPAIDWRGFDLCKACKAFQRNVEEKMAANLARNQDRRGA